MGHEFLDFFQNWCSSYAGGVDGGSNGSGVFVAVGLKPRLFG